MIREIVASVDSTSVSNWLPNSDQLKTAAALLTLFFGGGWLTNAVKKWQARRHEQNALKKLPAGDFMPETVESALQYYVEHEVSAVDPAGRERERANLGPREPLFRLLDRTLYGTNEKQYLLILADSGMGKTTALLNYYAHNSKRKNAHPMVVFSLRTEGVDAKIQAVTEKSSKILLLDALDEDPTAIGDHTDRVHTLMRLSQDFRAVVITCRSQFFLTSEEITKETGLAKIHHRGLGEPSEYIFLKFYLCPFSDAQIDAFLRKRYPFPQFKSRLRAKETIERVGDLTNRPMLLAYIDDLTCSGTKIADIGDAYQQIVDQWIAREKPLVRNSRALLEFSKRLAVELYIRREARGGEQAPATEIIGLAEKWGIPLQQWQLTGRSLLTRDAADQFRFAHRSILEFLFVRSFLEGNARCATVAWTDQMYVFLEKKVSGSHGRLGLRTVTELIINAYPEGVDRGLVQHTLRLAWMDFVLRMIVEQKESHSSHDERIRGGELAPLHTLFTIAFSDLSTGAVPQVVILSTTFVSNKGPKNTVEVLNDFYTGYERISPDATLTLENFYGPSGRFEDGVKLNNSGRRATLYIGNRLSNLPLGVFAIIRYRIGLKAPEHSVALAHFVNQWWRI
jgi:hypothetical protein